MHQQALLGDQQACKQPAGQLSQRPYACRICANAHTLTALGSFHVLALPASLNIIINYSF